MPNVNKVVYGNDTLIDLTSDTVTASDVLNSKSFHDASGTLRTGSADISGKADKVSNATNGNLAGLDTTGNLTDSGYSPSNFAKDTWSTQSQVSNGTISFSGIDDTNSNGYKLFIDVNSNSTELNPTSQITAISGAGTSSMSITFSTNADNGSYGKLRIIK